jgi:hypothetical protein
MHADVDPAVSCSRYFGSAFAAVSMLPISINWRDDDRVAVAVGGGVDLDWEIRLCSTPATRLLSAAFAPAGP